MAYTTTASGGLGSIETLSGGSGGGGSGPGAGGGIGMPLGRPMGGPGRAPLTPEDWRKRPKNIDVNYRDPNRVPGLETLTPQTAPNVPFTAQTGGVATGRKPGYRGGFGSLTPLPPPPPAPRLPGQPAGQAAGTIGATTAPPNLPVRRGPNLLAGPGGGPSPAAGAGLPPPPPMSAAGVSGPGAGIGAQVQRANFGQALPVRPNSTPAYGAGGAVTPSSNPAAPVNSPAYAEGFNPSGVGPRPLGLAGGGPGGGAAGGPAGQDAAAPGEGEAEGGGSDPLASIRALMGRSIVNNSDPYGDPRLRRFENQRALQQAGFVQPGALLPGGRAINRGIVA